MNQGYQWLKINVDARRVITIIFLNLRFLLIELIFATRRGGAERVSRGQGRRLRRWGGAAGWAYDFSPARGCK